MSPFLEIKCQYYSEGGCHVNKAGPTNYRLLSNWGRSQHLYVTPLHISYLPRISTLFSETYRDARCKSHWRRTPVSCRSGLLAVGLERAIMKIYLLQSKPSTMRASALFALLFELKPSCEGSAGSISCRFRNLRSRFLA